MRFTLRRERGGGEEDTGLRLGHLNSKRWERRGGFGREDGRSKGRREEDQEAVVVRSPRAASCVYERRKGELSRQSE